MRSAILGGYFISNKYPLQTSAFDDAHYTFQINFDEKSFSFQKDGLDRTHFVFQNSNDSFVFVFETYYEGSEFEVSFF
jgi:hypothetical protein